jgi:hypothetical protein
MNALTRASTIPDLQATWKADCEGKADYGSGIVRVSSRYWPPDDLDTERLHTAVSAVYLQDNPVVTEWFVGSTEAEVKAAVQAWADLAFRRAYAAILREFS